MFSQTRFQFFVALSAAELDDSRVSRADERVCSVRVVTYANVRAVVAPAARLVVRPLAPSLPFPRPIRRRPLRLHAVGRTRARYPDDPIVPVRGAVGRAARFFSFGFEAVAVLLWTTGAPVTPAAILFRSSLAT